MYLTHSHSGADGGDSDDEKVNKPEKCLGAITVMTNLMITVWSGVRSIMIQYRRRVNEDYFATFVIIILITHGIQEKNSWIP